jgi:hypothetical protein
MLKNKAVERTNTFAKTNAHTAVKTLQLAKLLTLAKKFHRSAYTEAGSLPP